MQPSNQLFEPYLQSFADCVALKLRVQKVLCALPKEVQRDFLGDPRFTIALDNYRPGEGSSVWMACPGTAGETSRSVVLRPRLEKSSEPFALYVIAHEFAHAYLRNGGWGEITDPEGAADALAAAWGFPRPPRWKW